MKNIYFIILVSVIGLSFASCSSDDENNNGGVTANVTAKEAKIIALNHAGLNVSEAVFVKSELDIENGEPVYEMEFYVNGKEYDYEVNAVTGTIVKYDNEIENFTLPESNFSMLKITAEEAKKTALDKAGLTESQITQYWSELDWENNRIVYDVSFKSGGYEYDVDINAATGEVIKYECERD